MKRSRHSIAAGSMAPQGLRTAAAMAEELRTAAAMAEELRTASLMAENEDLRDKSRSMGMELAQLRREKTRTDAADRNTARSLHRVASEIELYLGRLHTIVTRVRDMRSQSDAEQDCLLGNIGSLRKEVREKAGRLVDAMDGVAERIENELFDL
jgi:uncharacterized protein YaaN involved in tellurite resistance